MRGEPLPRAAFTLDGLERLRGWGRLWPPTPMFHQVGLRITQVTSGSAVASMPVSPWLLHPDGVVEVGFLGDVVCGIAADTVLKPGAIITPIDASYRPLRRLEDDCRTLVGRATVVRTSPDWAYVEGSVEDDAGRAVAHVSAHAAIHAVPFRLPEAAPVFEPISPPSYATPDPYRRPMTAERHGVIDLFNREGCVPAFRAISAGDAPLPPIYALFGIRPVDAAEGAVTTHLAASDWTRSVDPVAVGGAYLRTHAVTTGVAAIWTVIPEGQWPAIMDVHTVFVHSVPADGRSVVAEAHVERLSAELVVATVSTMSDGDRVAVTHVSARLRAGAAAAGRRRDRTLATVVFTDLVGSTTAVDELGDEAWRRLLERHQTLVRRRLDEHGGREIKTTGDGFLATFTSPTAAVECSRDIRDDVRRLGLEIRAGVHTGEVESVAGDVIGITVHAAARIEALAGPGEIWVSETVRTLTAGSGLRFADRGTHALTGIDEPAALHCVVG